MSTSLQELLLPLIEYYNANSHITLTNKASYMSVSCFKWDTGIFTEGAPAMGAPSFSTPRRSESFRVAVTSEMSDFYRETIDPLA